MGLHNTGHGLGHIVVKATLSSSCAGGVVQDLPGSAQEVVGGGVDVGIAGLAELTLWFWGDRLWQSAFGNGSLKQLKAWSRCARSSPRTMEPGSQSADFDGMPHLRR